MTRYMYLSLIPEALIVSMYPPNGFGEYMALGARQHAHGQGMFFEVDIMMAKAIMPKDFWEYIDRKCVPHENGDPKRSVYMKIYRALETIPVSALKSLYLVTNDGKVLKLDKSPYAASQEKAGELHLYQELGPVYSRIACLQPPLGFMRLMTDATQFASVPKLVFGELMLNKLATDPEKGSADELPYSDIPHLRDCLLELKREPQKVKKTVQRSVQGIFHYRMCVNGFFVGAKEEFVYYKFPGVEELNDKHHAWWRSANAVFLNR